MVSSRFCVRCGAALDAGAQFCRSCGTEVAAGQAAVPAAEYCPSCGSEQRPGTRFCRNCGAAMDGEGPPSRQSGAAGTSSQRMPLVIGGGVVAVAIAVLALTLLGDDAPATESVLGGTGGSTGSTESSIGGVLGQGSEMGAGIGVAEFPEPVEVELPEGEDLLGPNNRAAVADVEALLAEGGLDLSAYEGVMETYVFPVAGTGESILVLEGDIDAINALEEEPAASGDTTAFEDEELFRRLAELPAVQEANVTRIAMNLRGTDAEGAYVMTFTLPMELLLQDPEALDAEFAELTEEQAAELFQVELSR